MALNLPAGMQITAPVKPEWESILTTNSRASVVRMDSHSGFTGAVICIPAGRLRAMRISCWKGWNVAMQRILLVFYKTKKPARIISSFTLSIKWTA